VADERQAARAAGDAVVESVRQQPELELDQPVRYCGRDFTPAELATIQGIIAEDPDRSRFAISKLVCERLGWLKPNGELKDMSCRVAMLRMQDDGLITLPPPKQQHPNNIPFTRRSPDTQPGLPIEGEVSELRDLPPRPGRPPPGTSSSAGATSSASATSSSWSTTPAS